MQRFSLTRAIQTRRALTCSTRRHPPLSASQRMQLGRVRKAIRETFATA